MGVDYLQCSGCDRGYRDDSEHAIYCDCGCQFCRAICGKLDNCLSYEEIQKLDYEDPRVEAFENGIIQIDLNKPITCVICRKEKCNDYVLLQYLLKLTNLTQEQAIEKWRQDPEE